MKKDVDARHKAGHDELAIDTTRRRRAILARSNERIDVAPPRA
jgi:uncharacterized protein with von Willebrand factor type A (vWA) domain